MTKSDCNSILVVEDDIYFSLLLSEFLEDFGYEAVVCRTVEDALSLTENGAFALFVVDAMLPNSPSKSGITEAETRGGFQAGVALLRKLCKRFTQTPAILITAYPNAEVQSWCKDSGVNYLVKPVDRRVLTETISGLVGRRKIVRPPSCLIVHGHDYKTLEVLEEFIKEDLGFGQPIVLRNERGGGRTIIESLENYSRKVDIVFVLLVPEDEFCSYSDTEEVKWRARQNVIFELGLFYGYLGRLSGRVILLHRGPIDLPSDILGIIYVDISEGISAAGDRIRTELSFWLK